PSIPPLPLHDALPISRRAAAAPDQHPGPRDPRTPPPGRIPSAFRAIVSGPPRSPSPPPSPAPPAPRRGGAALRGPVPPAPWTPDAVRAAAGGPRAPAGPIGSSRRPA